ncbi:hypothetical protein FRB99_004448, partial [Tulasnella sp. 403]
MAPTDKEGESKRKRNALSSRSHRDFHTDGVRRLKLKCDRVFPCSSCRKRGCSAICPDGVLTTGKLGGRFILANTEELHEKIASLQSRIADLEDALSVSHASQSTTTHHLLRPDLLALKTPLGAEIVGRGQVPSSGEKSPSGEDMVESFGTLTIGEGGVATFYGSTVGSEFLFEEDDDADEVIHGGSEPERRTLPWLSDPSSHHAQALPFATLTSHVESVKIELRRCLPQQYHTACKLADSYFANAAWMYNPLHQGPFFRDVLQPLYDQSQTRPVSSHALAVVFSVFALGILVDLERQPYDREGERYHILSKSALSLESCLENTTIHAVQALILMAYYNQMTDKKNGPALTWSMNGLAMKLAQSIGLHRDWEKWGLPMEEVAIRRTVMWECICFDSWSAFGFGRPPSQAMHFVDCKQTPDPQIPNDPCASFAPLKYLFTEILLEVINASFGAVPPAYEEILKLDRRLRDYYIPPLFQVPGFNEDDKPRAILPPHPPLGWYLQSHALAMLRENALLYMHRSFFAKALDEHPEDPFKSRYAASVLACHRSACAIILLVRKLHHIEPRIVLRFWYFWVHSFTSSVVLASIVTKTPHSNLARSSMSHVELACDLFRQADAGSRPANTLPILLNLRQKASEVLAQYLNEPSPPGPGKGKTPPREGDDKLEPMLSGKTRLVTKKRRNKSDSQPSAEGDIPIDVDTPTRYPDALGLDVHPSLMAHYHEQQSQYHPGHISIPPQIGQYTSHLAQSPTSPGSWIPPVGHNIPPPTPSLQAALTEPGPSAQYPSYGLVDPTSYTAMQPWPQPHTQQTMAHLPMQSPTVSTSTTMSPDAHFINAPQRYGYSLATKDSAAAVPSSLPGPSMVPHSGVDPQTRQYNYPVANPPTWSGSAGKDPQQPIPGTHMAPPEAMGGLMHSGG